MHIVSVHNVRAGGTSRERMLTFSDYSIKALTEKFTIFYYWYMKSAFKFKLMLFERAFWLYERFYGFLRVKAEDLEKNLEDIELSMNQT